MKRHATTLALLAALAIPLAAPAVAEEGKQGGSIIVTYKDDIVTLDPAIGYDWVNWSIIKSLFARLMDYKPGTAELTPSLADSYEISKDGLTYTFKLHKGVKFHNGREVVAQDVKYSIERTTNPKTESPGAGFYDSIAGMDAFKKGKAKDVKGIAVVDPATIKFTLTRPDATFLHVLALNFSSVVPKEAVDKAGKDFGKKVVGSGAFMLADWKLGQELVLKRNPDYFMPGVPKLDQITFQVGLEPMTAILKLEKGEADFAGDGIPPAKFLQIRNDPKYKDLIIEGGQLQTGYMTLNVQMKPFDKLEVRQAVNMAIDKGRIVKIINNRAVPANQPLPPTMPGYDKEYKGYPFDPEKAKELLKQAGLEKGFETTLYVYNVDPNPRIAQAIQEDLSKIGIKVKLKNLAQANVIAAGGKPKTAPMVWSGGMAWIADFPDPSNFYGPILGCAGATNGGWNWAWYCNKELDERATKADSMSDPAKAAERAQLWKTIFTDIMKDAPWVPIFNEQRFTIRSKRVGGADALFVDPVRIPINYDHVYIKG
ncbi:MAG: ABC transporter substrate-binding protein [Burkholderiales bacterium]|nr:ABC transporter substrate-binding protein [Burkholderiales bacterium]